MRRPIVNKPLGLAYGTGELPAMIASSRVTMPTGRKGMSQAT